ncbi:MAG: class I SAM-dependent methyltransferase [Saprospiraceae bacterium]|nr:class I SAM-dependent methyltransferase [Saprospiraceae bacterium]
MNDNKDWFVSWFDSPFYHILYQNHNEQSAKDFIDNLFKNLTPQYAQRQPTSSYRILDLACGKGRHSRYIAQKGFDTTGIDLSENSIQYARQFETDNLSFFQHDMRKPFRINYFDYIFNFFTSFGYFDNETDNLLTLRCIQQGLKKNGVFILDYFNSDWIRQTFKSDYIQTVAGIDFSIQKRIEGAYIFKKITFQANEQTYSFQERVRLFTLPEFEALFEQAGLTIGNIYGDYAFNPFDSKTSNRLIIKAYKNK